MPLPDSTTESSAPTTNAADAAALADASTRTLEAAARAAAARWRWPAFALAMLLLLADQWTKFAAIEHLATHVHPMVVEADGTRTVSQLFADRGVLDGELAAAIGQRWVWRYDRAVGLTAAMDLDGLDAPRQLIATQGTGFPAPRRVRIDAADARRTLGAVLAERWRVPLGEVDSLLQTATYRARDVVEVAREVPPKGTQLALLSREITVVGGFMKLVYAENPGAAWGFMRDMDPVFRVAFFSVISVLASLGMIWAIWIGWMGSTLSTLALAAVLSGAIGNLIDRNLHTIVVDFILNFVGEARWPVYNVADIGISVGVALIMLELLLHRRVAGSATSTTS